MFRETQQFRQFWVWLLLSVVLLDCLRILTTDDGGIWSVVILLGVGLLFWVMKLRVETQTDTLHISYFPFLNRSIPYSDIASAEVEDYSLFTYRGWGLRYSFVKGWAYTVSGKQGVRLELASGKSLFLGSQQPEALAQAINDKR